MLAILPLVLTFLAAEKSFLDKILGGNRKEPECSFVGVAGTYGLPITSSRFDSYTKDHSEFSEHARVIIVFYTAVMLIRSACYKKKPF